MLTPAEAEQMIVNSLSAGPAEPCPLAQAHGRVLRAPVAAERDQPSFDRATMDGYALCFADWQDSRARRFSLQGFQAAGAPAQALSVAGGCWEIATGAVVPDRADCVVPYEEAGRDGDALFIPETLSLHPGQNIHRRGSDAREGQVLLEPGLLLRPHHVAVAAACGYKTVHVSTRLRIAVVVTGDELVEIDETHLAPHQVRRSNDYALQAALLAGGAVAEVRRFHLADRRDVVEKSLPEIIADHDVVLLTGGVSKGKLDLVPDALAAHGVAKKFQGVAQRPGKPFWFGVTPRGAPVFALPGNPVSTYACFHRYVRPALTRMAGQTPPRPDFVPLARESASQGKLAYLLPVHLETDASGVRRAVPHPFNTSGDFASLSATDGFVELPPSPTPFPAGTVARFWAWS